VGSGTVLIAELRDLARRAGHGRPSFADDPAVDWPAVDTAWVAYQSAERHFAGVAPQGPREAQAKQAALLFYYRDTNLAAARDAWRQQTEAPAGPTELAMVADFEAEAGSDAALPVIEQLRTYQPGEAAALLATLHVRRGRLEEAASALEEAFEDFRAHPWALFRFKERAVALAGVIGAQSPGLAARMIEALERPFALRALQDERLRTIAMLTRRADFSRLCRETIGALEPHVPWTSAFLSLRRDCYQAVGDPRLDTATRELDTFLSQEPHPLGNSVTPTP
jgi:tetratricopeptide (TPR) repeat protein